MELTATIHKINNDKTKINVSTKTETTSFIVSEEDEWNSITINNDLYDVHYFVEDNRPNVIVYDLIKVGNNEYDIDCNGYSECEIKE